MPTNLLVYIVQTDNTKLKGSVGRSVAVAMILTKVRSIIPRSFHWQVDSRIEADLLEVG